MNVRMVSVYVASIVTVVGYVLWEGHERRRIVADLGVADRTAVFESTLAGFQKLCVPGRGEGFEKYCDAQRDFLALFPECDNTCVLLLAKMERGPTR